ncbi:MAG: type II secretion system minor pseudopilin GspK [Desulfurivibrio sp.]|nr:type II secretion system minor pseudopilin GspK [Desulfurivibrio sp.]
MFCHKTVKSQASGYELGADGATGAACRGACVGAVGRNQRGVALLSALLAAALVTTLAAAMIFTQQVDIRRAGNVIHGDQAWLYAVGVEEWAGVLLSRAEPGSEYRYVGRELPPIAVVGGQVGGRLDDLQGRFNVNNLVLAGGGSEEGEGEPTPHQAQFRRLLGACDLDENSEQAVTDWLDADQQPRFPGGAEDNEYLRGEPAYRAANRPITDPAELALVRGLDNEEFRGCLRPLLSALPEATPLNVNTAPPPLLAALSDRLELERAERLVAERPAQGYESVSDFLEHPALAGSGLRSNEGLLTVQSRYFMVQSRARIGQGRVVLYSKLERQGGAVRVLQRSR